METEVYVGMNGAGFYYVFDREISKFLTLYQLDVVEKGFHSAFDVEGRLITINPSQCGHIEIYSKS